MNSVKLVAVKLVASQATEIQYFSFPTQEDHQALQLDSPEQWRREAIITSVIRVFTTVEQLPFAKLSEP